MTTEKVRTFVEPAERLLAEGTRLPDGNPLGASVAKWMSQPETLAFEERRDDFVAPFREVYAERPSAFRAAVLAEACFAAAQDARGVGPASSVSEKTWAISQRWNERGVEVLRSHADDGQTNLPWQSSRYTAVQHLGSSLDELNATFTQVFSLDTTNLFSLRTHGVFLLPRWLGNGPADLQASATWAAEQSELGDGAYAYIHGLIPAIGGVMPNEVACDVARIDQGYIALHERCASLRLLNEHAATLWLTGSLERVHHIFADGLRRIDHVAWGGDTSKEGMEFAARAFMESTGEA